jgi:hypothetical protein
MNVASDIVNPLPVKMTTDYLIDKAASRIPGGAAVGAATQSIKDIKNMTPLGSN